MFEIFSCTLVNWSEYSKIFEDQLGSNPVEVLDNARIDKNKSFLALQGSLGGSDYYKNLLEYTDKYAHTHLSLIGVVNKLIPLLDLNILHWPVEDKFIVLITGSLLQWRNLLLESDSKWHTEIYKSFERHNIPLWQDHEIIYQKNKVVFKKK